MFSSKTPKTVENVIFVNRFYRLAIGLPCKFLVTVVDSIYKKQVDMLLRAEQHAVIFDLQNLFFNPLLLQQYNKSSNTKRKTVKRQKIQLQVVQKKNPQNMEAPGKYYVQAVKTSSVDLEWMAKQIANQYTVGEPDCLAVLSAFVHNMQVELSQGRIVELGNLGNFQVGVHSHPSNTAEEVTLNNIKKVHINFRPARRMRDALKKMPFTLGDDN